MVAVKAAQVSAFIKKPPDKCKAVLVYGTDTGLVSERATQLGHYFANLSHPAAEIVWIGDTDLEDDPDRLVVELQTVSMFGPGKVVKTTLGRRVTGAAIKSILEAGVLEAALVVEAGNLKTSDTLRKAFEQNALAAALPCFADTERDLSMLIDEIVQKNQSVIANDAKHALLDRLGADRAQSRGEIEKLILFTGNRREITTEDVFAIVGDASATAIDTIISHTANGRAAQAVKEFSRTIATGENPQMIIAAIQRHFRRLHRVRGAMEAGQSFDDAVRGLRPPLFQKHKVDMKTQCGRWTVARLNTTLTRICEMIKLARLHASLDYELAERLILELATMACHGRQN